MSIDSRREVAPSRSLGERLRLARARAFVGREEQVAAFSAALRNDPTAALVFYLHGPGGVGKSTLVRHLADEARHANRLITELDGRFVGRSPDDFEQAAHALFDRPDAVLVVDSFEHCQWLETWLWQRFLPRIADGALVVLAGRQAPAIEWAADPGWAAALHVAELGPLSEEQARRLLAANGVQPENTDALLRFAGGNPLALSLAAAVDSASPGSAQEWSPSAETLGTLIVGLIGEVPSPDHRRALEVAAQAYNTTEQLLQAALPELDAHELFAWLRGLPFMESTAHGCYPHDAVRESVVADLRWRAPEAFQAMKRRLSAEYLRQIRELPEQQALGVMSQLYYLFRDQKNIRDVFRWGRTGQVQDDPLRPEDVETVIRMAAGTEGPESAELVRYWIGKQPAGFSVYRSIDTGEVVAFGGRIDLPAPPDPEDIAVDPVVAAAWEHCLSTTPPAPDEYITITRFLIYPEAYQVPSPVTNLHHSRVQATAARSRGMAQGMIVLHDTELWARLLRGALTDVGVRPRVGDRTYGLFVTDWRQVPFEMWLDNILAATDVPVATTQTARADFDQSVRETLQNWRSRRAFALSDLLTSRLVADADDPVAELRALMQRTVDEIGQDARTIKAREALVATYFSGAPTQEAAARRAGMSFSTYRRHLRQGIDMVCSALWDLQLRGRSDQG
ncbi:AAA family ATPase [Micromonospora sp. NPDC000442]|uniref:AAA family ATPase n=1 Tax=Micromonospora sp. NPDC000442 TaxID=3364217 RepID=UPI0036A92BE3